MCGGGQRIVVEEGRHRWALDAFLRPASPFTAASIDYSPETRFRPSQGRKKHTSERMYGRYVAAHPSSHPVVYDVDDSKGPTSGPGQPSPVFLSLEFASPSPRGSSTRAAGLFFSLLRNVWSSSCSWLEFKNDKWDIGYNCTNEKLSTVCEKKKDQIDERMLFSWEFWRLKLVEKHFEDSRVRKLVVSRRFRLSPFYWNINVKRWKFESRYKVQ